MNDQEKSKGRIRASERKTVYAGGPIDACYTIKFTQRGTDPMRIQVIVGGVHVTTLDDGDSTDVCGKIIEIEGVGTWQPRTHTNVGEGDWEATRA